jgi:ribosomal protein S21
MKKKHNVKVTSRECRNNTERMIRKFIKKCKKERIIEEVKDRRHYKKPSVAKKEKSEKARRAKARLEQKRQRAKERRNRRNK